LYMFMIFFFQAEDGIRDRNVTGVQTCALPILYSSSKRNIIEYIGGNRNSMDYITLKEASEKWGISTRQINYYCIEGRIPGAVKMATIWLIPKDAKKPIDMRTRQG